MTVLFCSDPMDRSRVDDPYKSEFEAARRLGLRSALINHDALVADDDLERALKKVPSARNPESAFYRGWMVRSRQYARFHEALLRRGIRLVNDPAAYAYCHELPNWIHDFPDITPKSVVVPLPGPPDFSKIRSALGPLAGSAIVLKDYVKSQKHYWNEACFIPDASDGDRVESVTRRFLELQGDSLVGGLVYREFVDLESVGVHPKSSMPLALEFRIFFFDGRPLYAAPYWESADYKESQPPLDPFAGPASRVKSRFFTMDVARAKSGDWILVELGDGQVAGLPDHADVDAFYAALGDRLKNG